MCNVLFYKNLKNKNRIHIIFLNFKKYFMNIHIFLKLFFMFIIFFKIIFFENNIFIKIYIYCIKIVCTGFVFFTNCPFLTKVVQIWPGGPQAGPRWSVSDFWQNVHIFFPFLPKNNIKSSTIWCTLFIIINIRARPRG